MSRGVLCLLAVAWVGCLGAPIRAPEIPDRAIAISHHDAETMRKRAEARATANPANLPVRSQGVAHADDVTSYLGGLLGAPQPGQADDQSLVGRLAFLDPRTGRVAKVAETRPGAVPRAWSPDGERLIYTQLVGEFRQLFELTRSTREVRQLTRGRDVHPDGCYGPDGRYVLGTARVEYGRPVGRIALTEPGGTRPRAISPGPSDYGPACAPDGSAVAWVSVDERGRDQLMVRRPVVDGPVRRIGPGRDPAFSPDSEWIVYSALVKRRWALHRVRPDGSGRRPIGTGRLDEFQPSFSPDGQLVVYVSDDGYDRRIYLRRFDGTGDRVLLQSGGGEDPVW